MKDRIGSVILILPRKHNVGAAGVNANRATGCLFSFLEVISQILVVVILLVIAEVYADCAEGG